MNGFFIAHADQITNCKLHARNYPAQQYQPRQPTNWKLTIKPIPALNFTTPDPPKLHHSPAPNVLPTLSVYNQSCLAKQSESTGKTVGAGARPPFSAVGGPGRAPKAQITSHIMRDLAQQALPLFLSLSLTDRETDPLWHYC